MPLIARRIVSLALVAAGSLLDGGCGDPECALPLGGGTFFPNAEVEPSFAVDPSDGAHLIGAWQQDRYSNGGARSILSNVSFDAAAEQTPQAKPQCIGGHASTSPIASTMRCQRFSSDSSCLRPRALRR